MRASGAVVRAAEVERILGFGNTADPRARETASSSYEAEQPTSNFYGHHYPEK
jgi:hypothetical protein